MDNIQIRTKDNPTINIKPVDINNDKDNFQIKDDNSSATESIGNAPKKKKKKKKMKEINPFQNKNRFDVYANPSKQISQKIKLVLRQSDLFARIGGDEFALFLSNINVGPCGSFAILNRCISDHVDT